MDIQKMLAYCAALDAHNDRTWFHEHHAQYEDARAEYLALLDFLRFSVAENAPALKKDILYMQPKDWMYRVARDMRYHHDGVPYEPSFRAYIAPDRRSWKPVGYFLCIEPHASCFGTGIWCRDSADANRVRSYIAAYPQRFADVLEQAGIPQAGEQLKRMPRGFEAWVDKPEAAWLRCKSWNLIEHYTDADLASFEQFDARIRDAVRRMEPFRQFLLEACSREALSEEQRGTQAVRDFYATW